MGGRAASLAGLGVCALLVGCTPPMPPDVLAARAERTITCVDGTQQVSVPAEYAEAVDAVGQALTALCPEQVIEPVTDPAAVTLLDHPPTGQELSDFALQCEGDVLTTPVSGTPIVLAYNIAGLDGLLLTPDAVAGILSGRITSWADPAITGPNEGFDIPDIPILLQRLEGPSGAVEAMTAWLTAGAPEAWTAGQVDTLTAGDAHPDYVTLIAAMTGDVSGGEIDDLFEEDFDFSLDGDVDLGEGNPEDFLAGEEVEIDLEADIAFEALPGEGTVAVMPAFIANTNVIPIAAFPVGEATISITNVDLPKVGIAAMGLTTDDQGRMFATHAVGGVPIPEQFDIASAKVIAEEGQELVGWPVIAMSSILVCDEAANPLPLSTAQFFLRLGGQGVFDSVGLTPLPEPVRVQAIPAMRVVLDNLEDDTIELDGETPVEPSS